MAKEAAVYPGCTRADMKITGFLNLCGLQFYGKSRGLNIAYFYTYWLGWSCDVMVSKCTSLPYGLLISTSL